MFGRRPDGTLVTDLSAMRRFMPFVSPRRNDSLVYFSQVVDAEPGLAFLERINAGRPPDRQVTYFHLLLRALTRCFAERPRLNRFVSGGRLYQRDGIWLSFSAKRAFTDDAPILTVKRRMDLDGSLVEMVDAIHDKLDAGRRGKRTTSDNEMDLMLRLPTPLIRLLMACARGLDALGLLPRGMIDADPLYVSGFLANLGSIGIEAGYHHLWEWGNCPVFGVLGLLETGPDGRRRVEIKWTYEERIEDGFNAALGLGLVREGLEQPEKLA
jgi:hypothetical protein